MGIVLSVLVVALILMGLTYLALESQNQAIMLQAKADVMTTQASQDFWLSLMPWFLIIIGVVVVGVVIAVWLNSRKGGETYTTNNIALIAGPEMTRADLRRLASQTRMPELVGGQYQIIGQQEFGRLPEPKRKREKIDLNGL